MNQHTANFQKIQAKTCGIYQIVLTTDGRCYVGQSKDIRERWYHHRSALDNDRHHSPYLQHAWDKHGADAFRFELLEECDLEMLTEREQLWLDKLQSDFNLIRIAGPGPHGHSPSAETRAKIAATSTGRKHGDLAKSKVSAAQTGRPKSQAHREKLAAAQVARRDACAQGHIFDDENTAWRVAASGNLVRQCKRCDRDKAQRYRERKKNAQ